MKPDVLSTMHFIVEAWRLITPAAINNCFVTCGFSNDHVSSNDDSAVKLSEDEEYNWHSLHPLGAQCEDYTIYDSALEVCGIPSANHMSDQHLTIPEDEKKSRKLQGHKATFLDAMKELTAARSTCLIPKTILLNVKRNWK
jgi:hypothetical protein